MAGEGIFFTFENFCREDKSISLNDRTTKIFLNASGEMDDTSRELKAFLDYVAGKESDDAFVEKLKEAVAKAKENREWRHEYMTLLMRNQENIEKGIQQGIQQEREQGIRLMIESGKELGVNRDSMFTKIMEKYNLNNAQAAAYMDKYWI